MADQTARLAVSLDSSGVKAGASSASAQLNALKSTFQKSNAEVKALEATLRTMQKTGGAVDVKAYKELKDRLAVAKTSAADAAGEFVNLGGATTELNAAAKTATGGMAAMPGIAASMGITAAGAAAAVLGFAAAVVAAWVSLGALVKRMAEFALTTTDARRTSLLLMETWTKGAANATIVDASIRKIADSVPLASSEVAGLAQQLYMSGLRGKELEDALYRASLVAAGLPKNASPELIAKRMLSLDIQIMKVKENFSKLFSGVKIEAFLRGLQSLLSVFDEHQASARALKKLVEVIFDPILEAGGKVLPVARNIFRGMVIGALLAAVGVLTLRKALLSTIPKEAVDGIKGLLSRVNGVWVAVYAGVAIVGLIIIAFFALVAATVALTVALGILALVALAGAAVAFGLLVVPVLVLIGSMLLMAAILLLPFVALGILIAGFVAAAAYLLSFSDAASAAGLSIAQGLANGITNGAGLVMQAIQALGTGAMSALKATLGIASPSKAFAGLGAFTAEGFAEGVEGGSKGVNSAVGAMVSIPPAQAGKGAKSGGGGGMQITVNVNGVSGADAMNSASFARKIAEALEDMLDGTGGTAEVMA